MQPNGWVMIEKLLQISMSDCCFGHGPGAACYHGRLDRQHREILTSAPMQSETHDSSHFCLALHHHVGIDEQCEDDGME